MGYGGGYLWLRCVVLWWWWWGGGGVGASTALNRINDTRVLFKVRSPIG